MKRALSKKVNLLIPRLVFIINSYTKSRGAPAMLKIGCAACGSLVLFYQKDGPGPLKRCYLDRIHYPAELSSEKNNRSIAVNSDSLKCKNCKAVLGIPTIYKKEMRPALAMKRGCFTKKLVVKLRKYAGINCTLPKVESGN